MLKRFASLLLIAPILVLKQTAPASAQPSLEERLSYFTKPAVVRVLVACHGEYRYDPSRTPDPKDGTLLPYTTGEVGTGFFVDPKGYIVTSAHVVKAAEEDKKDNEKACKDRLHDNLVKDFTGIDDPLKVPKEEVEQIDAVNKFEESKYNYKAGVILPNGDFREFATIEPGDPDRTNIAVIKIDVPNSSAPILKFGDSEAVKIQDSVLVIGFPIAANTFAANSYAQYLLLLLGSGNRALPIAAITPANIASGNFQIPSSKIRASQVSGSDETETTGASTNPDETEAGGIATLQLSGGEIILTDHGSSGSPVVDKKTEEGEVVGVITDFSGSGIGVPVAIPSSTITDFVERAGADNVESDTGRDYREGLKFFWSGDYERAKAIFESVEDRFPQHSEVKDLITKANQMISEKQRKSDYTPWLFGLGGVAVLLLGMGAYLFFKTSRRELAAAQVGVVNVDPLQMPASVMPRRATSFLPSPISRTQPYLELRNQQGQVQRFALRENYHQIGRGREWADINLPDQGWEVLSRKHAFLRKEQDDYRIYDGDGNGPSMNGTFLNDALVDAHEGYLLKDQDELKIGQDPESFVTLKYFNPQSRRSR